MVYGGSVPAGAVADCDWSDTKNKKERDAMRMPAPPNTVEMQMLIDCPCDCFGTDLR